MTSILAVQDAPVTVLGPGFTAHAQGSAAWSDRSDSPLTTDHHLTASGKVPMYLELPPRGHSQSAALPAQASLPSAARSASTEPASHSAHSDVMHGPPWAPTAVGGSSCVSPGRTLSGGHACWTLPAGMLNAASGGIQKSMSGGSPWALQGGLYRGDSLQGFPEDESSRIMRGSSEISTPPVAMSSTMHSHPFSMHPSEMAGAGGNSSIRTEGARIKSTIGSNAPTALCRAGSSASVMMRAPEGVLTLLGDAQGLAIEGIDSEHAQRALASQQPPANDGDLTGADAAKVQGPPQHATQRTHAHMRSAATGPQPPHPPGGMLPRMCSLGSAWDGLVTHGNSAVHGPGGESAQHAQYAQHAGFSRIPFAEGMAAVSRSETVAADTDEVALDASGHQPPLEGSAPDSPQTTAGGAEPAAASQGIAAQWRDLKRGLRRSQGPRGSVPRLVEADAVSRSEHASARPLEPPAGVSGSATGAGAAGAGGEQTRRLARQLDLFSGDNLFLGRFRMLGRDQQRRGGVVHHYPGSYHLSIFASVIVLA